MIHVKRLLAGLPLAAMASLAIALDEMALVLIGALCVILTYLMGVLVMDMIAARRAAHD